MSEFESDSGLMCVNSDAKVIDENGSPVGFSIFDALKITELERQMAHQGNFTRVIPVRNLFTGATMAIRREVLRVALPLDDQMIHDDWIGSVSWILGRAFTIYSPLIEYRVHGQNSVGLGAGERSTKLSGVAARLADLQHQISRLAPLEKRFRDRGLEDYPRIKHLAALLKHLRFRVSMYSLPRDKRLVGIMRELLSRNYSAHSNGAISAIMDIILRCEN